jgi:hypothetical protein
LTAGGNKFSKVQTGQRRILPADVWNAMLETIEYVDGLRESGGALTGPMSRSPTIIQVANQSGRDISAYGVLALDTPTITPAADLHEWCNRWAMTGVVPQLPGYFGKFCVPIEGIRAGEVGPAVVAGVVPVVVDQPGDIALPFADVGHNRTDALVTGTVGLAQILWQESGKGIHWALVRLAPPETIIRAVLLEDLPACGTARAQVLDIKPDKTYVPDRTIVVADAIGVMDGNLLAVEKNGQLVMPAGTCAYVKYFFDSTSFEVLNYGGCCASGSGSEGSDSGGSGSGPSGSSGEESGSGPCGIPPCPTDGCKYHLVCDGGCPRWEVLDCGSGSDSGSGSPSGSDSGSGLPWWWP